MDTLKIEYVTTENNTLTITRYTDLCDVGVPGQINGFIVNTIGEYAFR